MIPFAYSAQAHQGGSMEQNLFPCGYMSEAAKAVLGYAFDGVGVTRTEGKVPSRNTASARVLERLGFIFESHTRLSTRIGDANWDDWPTA